MGNKNDTGLLTPEQLSERWQGKIKPSTLAQWRYEGKGPPVTKIGNKIFYAEASIEVWERAQETRVKRAL